MATKGKNGFGSAREQSKWDALQKAGSVSINKMLSGNAAPADLKALSTLVAKQSKLAADIFDKGVDAAHAEADAIVDKLNKGRVAKGKPELTTKAHDRLFQQFFQKILSENTEEILGSVKDYMDTKFEENLKDTSELLNKAFAKIRDLAGPKDNTGGKLTKPDKKTKKILEVVTDLNKVLTEANPPATIGKPTSLLSNFRKMFKKHLGMDEDKGLIKGLTNLYKRPGDTQARAEGAFVLGKPKYNLLHKIRHPWESKKDYLKWEKDRNKKKMRNMLAASKSKSLKDVEKDLGVRSDKDIIDSINELNKANPELAKKTPVDKQIETALKSNKVLSRKAEADWDKIRDARADVDEDKKEEGWLRKVRSFFGKKKQGGKEEGMGGIMGMLLKGLGLALLAPELFHTLATFIGEHFNYDNVAKFMGDEWEDIKKASSSILDWITNKAKSVAEEQKKKAATLNTPAAGVNQSIVGASNISETTSKRDAEVGMYTARAHTATVKNNLRLIQKKIDRQKMLQGAGTMASGGQGFHIEGLTPEEQAQYASGQTDIAASERREAQYKDAMSGITPGSKAAGAILSGRSKLPSTINSQLPGMSTSVRPENTPSSATPAATPPIVPVNPQGAAPAGTGGDSANSTVSNNSFGVNSGDDILNAFNMRIAAA